MLDGNSPIPLYYQLKARIEEQIESGHWKPGDRVPSESELGEFYRVSRTTVRQALAELVNQGMLLRIQGKGTFVAEPRIQQHLSQLTSFTQDMQARGKKPDSQVLRLELVSPPALVKEALQLRGHSQVILLQRLRLADAVPMAIENAYLHFEKCKAILDADIAGASLYQLLQSVGVIPTRARQQWTAVACPAVEARLLGISKGGPVLRIQRTTYDQYDHPFEQVESYYRGDRYIFQAELSDHHLEGAHTSKPVWLPDQ
jgi:GntR family transcriptional regulator